MRTFSILLAVILVAGATVALAGDDGKGGQPGVFRDVKIGGRPAAMGGAFTAIAEGGVGHLYNPAGLAQSRRYDVSFSYRVMQLDRRLGFASVAVPAKENARLGFNWLYAGTADLEPRDEQGNIIDGQAISYNENLIGITFAKQFIPELLLGGKLFYVQNNVANISASSVGVDFGGLVKLDARKTFLKTVFPLFTGGLAVENLGVNYRWSTSDYWQTRGREQGVTVDESFPINFRGGVALSYPGRYAVAADLEINSASITKTHFGGEYTIRKMLALRAGLDDIHPTFGIGLYKRLERFAMAVDLSYLTDRVGEGDDILMSFDIIF